MQYFRFLFEPGLKPISRFQVLQAILMYIAPPAWIAMMLAAIWQGLTVGLSPAKLELGVWLFVTIFLLSVTPKLAGGLDVLLSRGATKRYGGLFRFGLSMFFELVAAMLMAPIVAVYVSTFLVGLLFGRSVTWSGQNRDRLGVSLPSAAKAMAVQTAIGCVLAVVIYQGGGIWAVLWSLPFVCGLCLAIPFTIFTASPVFGRWTTRFGLFSIPEESHMPRVLSGIVPDEARRWRRLTSRRPSGWADEDAAIEDRKAAARA
jgi:membrane glycosyltransferase